MTHRALLYSYDDPELQVLHQHRVYQGHHQRHDVMSCGGDGVVVVAAFSLQADYLHRLLYIGGCLGCK